MMILQVLSAVGTEYGGASTTSVSLHRALRAFDPTAVLVSTTYASNTGARMSGDEIEELLAHANVTLFRPSRPYSWQFSMGLLVSLPSLVRNSSFVHIHGLHMFASVYAFILCRLLRKPYGIQTHGTLEPYDRAKSAKKKRIFMWLIGNRMFKHASYTTFASASEAENASDIVPPGKHMIAPLGVSLPSEERPRDEAVSALVERTPRANLYLYLGRYAAKKQPKLALEAWAKAHPPGSILLLAGPDGSFTARELRGYAASLNISNSVVVAGLMSRAESAWLYARCGFFVLPSLNENFGLTAVEAMAEGCFVITTSEVASSAHIVRTGGGEVLDAPDADDLSKAYLRAQSRLHLAADNARYAAEELTWARAAQILHDRVECIVSAS